MYKLLLSLLTAIIIAFTLFKYETPQKPAVLEVPQTTGAIEFINEKNNNLLRSALQLLSQAKHSILIANYSYNNPQMLHILNKKAEEGVAVTVIYDRLHSARWISQLDPRIKRVTRSDGEGYVHHKIIVVDDSEIWFSSANFDSFNAKNLTLSFSSPALATFITREMESIDGRKPRFHVQPFQSVIGGQRIEMFFLPHNEPDNKQPIETAMNELGRKKLISLINKAKTSIQASVVVFTYRDVAKALANAKKRGVNVQFVGSNIESNVQKILESAGIPITIVKSPYHHKWMLIDDKILWNGSANWSVSAFSRTDDSVIVLYDLTPEQVQFLETMWRELINS